jgi:putative hydrolase of the HAD superfamily
LQGGRLGAEFKSGVPENFLSDVIMDTDRLSVKAVTFDLWETLLFERDGDSGRRSAARCSGVAEAFDRLGVHVPAEQVDSAMKQVIASLVKVWDSNVDVSHVEQLELLVRSCSKGSLALKNEWVEELSSAYVSPFFESPPYLNPDAISVLGDLAEAGKQIGLICNTGLTPGFALRRFLESEGALRYFDFLAFSDEVGFRKPDRRFFHVVARKLKIDPCSVVHVGNNLKVDVWGAKNAGFRAIHFVCEEGRDKIAEADPTSLVAQSRKLSTLKKEQIAADKTITSFNMITEAIEQLEKET